MDSRACVRGQQRTSKSEPPVSHPLRPRKRSVVEGLQGRSEYEYSWTIILWGEGSVAAALSVKIALVMLA